MPRGKRGSTIAKKRFAPKSFKGFEGPTQGGVKTACATLDMDQFTLEDGELSDCLEFEALNEYEMEQEDLESGYEFGDRLGQRAEGLYFDKEFPEHDIWCPATSKIFPLLLYKGAKPSNITYLTEGPYGAVFRYDYDDNGTEVPVLVKVNYAEKEVLEGIQVAVKLSQCDAVSFRVMYSEVNQHVYTIMEYLDGDIDSLKYRAVIQMGPALVEDLFIAFFMAALKCLMNSNASMPAMRPANVGYRLCDADAATGPHVTSGGGGTALVFRLIDVDGIGGRVSSLPAVPVFAYQCTEPGWQQLQTVYAFAVTAIFFLWSVPFKGQSEKDFSQERRAAQQSLSYFYQYEVTAPGGMMVYAQNLALRKQTLENYANDTTLPESFRKLFIAGYRVLRALEHVDIDAGIRCKVLRGHKARKAVTEIFKLFWLSQSRPPAKITGPY